MKKRNIRTLSLLFVSLAAGVFIFTACNKNSNGTGRLEVRLTDDPSQYQAVYIDVQKVEVNVSSDPGATSGWQTLPLLHPGVYDLLKFKNGIDKVIYLNVSDKEALWRLSFRTDEQQVREDETLAALRKRIESFYKFTKPVLKFYKQKGQLVEINGEQPVKKIYSEILSKLSIK